MPAAARIKCPNTNLAKPPVSNSPNPKKAKYQQQDRRHLNIFKPTKETIANFRTSGTLSHTYFNVSRAKCEPSTKQTTHLGARSRWDCAGIRGSNSQDFLCKRLGCTTYVLYVYIYIYRFIHMHFHIYIKHYKALQYKHIRSYIYIR